MSQLELPGHPHAITTGRRFALARALPLLHEVEQLLSRGRIAAALEMLNARTRYRATALHAFEPPHLRTVYEFDRETRGLATTEKIQPIEDTYCSFVRSVQRPFCTENAAGDSRLSDHPARGVTISFIGVPVWSRDGSLWGVLCHHDARPRFAPTGEQQVLTDVATVLARWLISVGLMSPVADRRMAARGLRSLSAL